MWGRSQHRVHSRNNTKVCWFVLGIRCIFFVRPEDVIANVGDHVSFNGATNSSSKRRGVRWIYTSERNFRRPNHICVGGVMFPKWKMRHNVTESMDHSKLLYISTLTISSVNSNDVGFYTSMDLEDDSKTTAQLKPFTGNCEQLLHVNKIGLYNYISRINLY